MKRVVIESPYAGKSANDILINEAYGDLCMRDCLLNHNESPYASHLLYTRKFVLRDSIPEERKLGIEAGFLWRDVAEKTVLERKLGIEAGFLWRDVAEKTVFYIDLGMTIGMKQGIDDCEEKGKDYEVRHLHPDLWKEFLVVEREIRKALPAMIDAYERS